MKIEKKAKVLAIDNPFRPQTGIPRNNLVCRFTTDVLSANEHEHEYSIRLDFDYFEDFVVELEKVCPKIDYIRDTILDFYLVKYKHRDTLLELCKTHFDRTTLVEGG